VAVLANIFALGFVEDVANVGAREAAGLHERDEIFDEFLEEDIVLPECVVGIDEQGVAAHVFAKPFPFARAPVSLPVRARFRRFLRRQREAWSSCARLAYAKAHGVSS